MSKPRTAAIFVQAPADLPFALSIYDDKRSARENPWSCSCGRRSIYEFVRGLPLDGAVRELAGRRVHFVSQNSSGESFESGVGCKQPTVLTFRLSRAKLTSSRP